MIPGGAIHTINDLTQGVIDALQSRTDVSAIVPTYLMRAIQEVTESYPFEELRQTGPNVTLTVGQTDYPVSTFLNANDDYTFPEVMAIYVDFPANTVLGPVYWKNPTSIELMTSPATVGLPSRYTRFGPNFRFGPTPNNPYTLFLRYQKRHPFNGDIGSSPVYLPDSWEEIVQYAAAMRIAIVKRWTDQYQVLHNILYGDPSDPTMPGLIAKRRFQSERDSMFNTRQIMPVVQRYNSR